MSTLSPLGDSHFFDVGFQSPNEDGNVIGYQSDVWGGAVLFSNRIPNPPQSQDYYVPEFTVDLRECCEVIIPPVDPCDRVTPPGHVPEPATFLLMFAALLILFTATWIRNKRRSLRPNPVEVRNA